MAKISTYAISTPVVDDDKWIGTDASALKETKNFTARDVAEYLNDFDKVESDSLRYEYQNWETGDVRKAGSISGKDMEISRLLFSKENNTRLQHSYCL